MSGHRGFTEFVAARGTNLLRIAHLTCGSRQEAEDVLQSALEKAYRRSDDGPVRPVMRLWVERPGLGYVRGAALHSARWLDDFLRGWKRRTSPVAGPNITGIRTTGADGRIGAFRVASYTAVHVTVSPELAGELDRITAASAFPPPDPGSGPAGRTACDRPDPRPHSLMTSTPGISS